MVFDFLKIFWIFCKLYWDMGKWAKYARKYKKDWEKENWATGWLVENKNEDPNSTNEAFCKVCRVSLRAHVTDLKRHTTKNGHKKKMTLLNPVQKRQSTLSSILITNEQKESELKLAVYIAMHCSVQTIDHLGELLKDLGKGSGLASLRLHRTKCSGLIKHVVSPTLLENLVQDIADSKFSIIVDESTDVSVVKYLCLCIRYYSVEKMVHVTEFLGLIMLENGTANCLYAATKEYFSRNHLNLSNLIGIGTDGANSLCGENHSLYTLLKEEVPNLKLVRCVCHSLNNACSKAVDQLPAHVEFLCREVYNWFSQSSNRKVQYKEIFDLINTNERQKLHSFVQPSTTRWLSRYNSVNVILENWLELQTHFNLVVNKEKCFTARLLKDIFSDNENYLYLKFLKPILLEINKQNLNFQSTYMDVTKAHGDLENLFLVLCRKIFKPAFVNQGVSTLSNNFNNDLSFLEPSEADYGIEYYQSLQNYKIDLEKKRILEQKMFLYLKSLCYELSIRLPISLNHFKKLSYLSPDVCLSQLRPKFKDLPFIFDFIEPAKLGVAELEYNKLLDVDWVVNDNTKNIYRFWSTVLNFKTAGGDNAFKELGTYAVNILSLPTSNAIVERVFSIMNNVKTKTRNRMMLNMIESIMRIRIFCYTNAICCKNFDITKSMYSRFKSDVVYDQCNKTDWEDEMTEVVTLFNDV